MLSGSVNSLLSSLTCIAACCFASGAVAASDQEFQSIQVRNSGFEAPSIEPDEYRLGSVGESWNVFCPYSPKSAVGIYRNALSIKNGNPQTDWGDQYACLSGRKTDANNRTANQIYQQVLGGQGQESVVAGKKYTLTVSLIDMTGARSFYLGLFADAQGAVPFVQKIGSNGLSRSEWKDVSVEWIASASDVGKPVYILFSSRDFVTDTRGRVGIDNVRLTVSEATDKERETGRPASSTDEDRSPGALSFRQTDAPPTLTGRPLFEMQEIFTGRGGRSIVVAQNGTLIAFHTQEVGIRRSFDAGKTWGAPELVGKRARGNAILDEITGDIMLVDPSRAELWRSRDNGDSWQHETFSITPDAFGHGLPDDTPSRAVAAAAESGVTLQFGDRKGRLLMSTRIQAPGTERELWYYHYNSAIYSDDGGKSWHTSAPFPVLGTGEGALAELSDGRIYYNSRSHTATDTARRIAWSYDEGETWINPEKCDDLPDGMTDNPYGCHGGLVRLPYKGIDILLYSNVDGNDSSGRQGNAGNRRNITVWASFDGGQTWPVKRSVYSGPSGYSGLAAGRPGTSTEGMIYMVFEGGADGQDSAVQSVRFNLDWLLNGYDLNVLLGKNMNP